jgi:hypothetical protein
MSAQTFDAATTCPCCAWRCYCCGHVPTLAPPMPMPYAGSALSLWGPLLPSFQVYTSDKVWLVDISADAVHLTAGATKYAGIYARHGGAMKYQFQLCRDHSGRGACAHGAECKFIHADLVEGYYSMWPNPSAAATPTPTPTPAACKVAAQCECEECCSDDNSFSAGVHTPRDSSESGEAHSS